jgi:hypothetical protein
MSPTELAEIHAKLDAVLEHREIKLSDIKVSIVAVVVFLLSLMTPLGFAIANHYAIREHLGNTRIHADEEKAEKLGGVAYVGDVAQKERQGYFLMRAIHCGTLNGVSALCASSYPDGPYPVLSLSPSSAPKSPVP